MRRIVIIALASLCCSQAVAKDVTSSRAFGTATYSEVIRLADTKVPIVGVPNKSAALKAMLAGLSFDDTGTSLLIEFQHGECHATGVLNGYGDIDSETKLLDSVDSFAPVLFSPCGLDAGAVTTEKQQIRNRVGDMLSAVAYMKVRAEAIFGSSLVRCEHRSRANANLIERTLDGGPQLPRCREPGE